MSTVSLEGPSFSGLTGTCKLTRNIHRDQQMVSWVIHQYIWEKKMCLWRTIKF